MGIGRLGERVAAQLLARMVGDDFVVHWVNAGGERGLPYDIVVSEPHTRAVVVYVEVKASVRTDKVRCA